MEYHDIDETGVCLGLISDYLKDSAEHGVVLSFEITYVKDKESAAPLYRLFVHEKTKVLNRVYQGRSVVLFSSSAADEVVMFLKRHMDEIKGLRTDYAGPY